MPQHNLNPLSQAVSELTEYSGSYYLPADAPSANDSVWLNADYPQLPTYDEAGALFFNSAATGANDGTSRENGYTSALAALTALCAAPAGSKLICSGTFDIGDTIELNGLGGVGDANNWYEFRAHETDGCNITCSNPLGGIEFGGQRFWHIADFNILSGGRIFGYFVGGSSGGGVENIMHTNITGAMTAGGDNVGWMHYDVGASKIGAYNCPVVGPGITGDEPAYGNTSVIWMSRVPEWRIINCELSNAPRAFYYKHYETDIAGVGNQGQLMVNCYAHTCTDLQLACSNAEFRNNIFVCQVFVGDTGGGDNGSDNNRFINNTIQDMHISVRDNQAQNSYLRNNLIYRDFYIFPYSAVTPIIDSDYNLVGNRVLYNDGQFGPLSGWQSFSSQDANSVFGLPTFVGGASPSNVAGFDLQAGSLGIDSDESGDDIGVDVLLVGAVA